MNVMISQQISLPGTPVSLGLTISRQEYLPASTFRAALYGSLLDLEILPFGVSGPTLDLTVVVPISTFVKIFGLVNLFGLVLIHLALLLFLFPFVLSLLAGRDRAGAVLIGVCRFPLYLFQGRTGIK